MVMLLLEDRETADSHEGVRMYAKTKPKHLAGID